MFFRGETTCVLIHFILTSFLRTNGRAAQAEKCGGLLRADKGEIGIQPSKSNCLWIIKLKSMTGLSLELKEFTTEPITVIPAQKNSRANLQSTWMVGPEATYTFEGKIFAILASPRNQKTSLNWTGLTAEFSDVTLNAKFERSLEGSLEWERKLVGVDTTIWAVEPEGTGELNWEMSSDLSHCGQDSPCQCISFGVIHVMPDGRISNILNSCEDSSEGSWRIEKNSLLVLMFTESAIGEGSKLRATWKCEEELLKRKVTGIAAATDGGLYIVALNPPKTIQVSSKSVSGVAFDWNSEKIYWAEKGVGIMRTNLDGSDFEQLVADQRTGAVGIESITGNLYYVSESRKFLRVCNNDGKKCSSIVSLPGLIWDVAFHPPKGFLFWFDTDNKIFRANLDGSYAKQIAHRSSYEYGMDVDECTDRLYTYNYLTYKIIIYDLNGQNLGTPRETYPYPRHLKVDGEKLYYSSKWSSSLWSISPADLRATLVAELLNYPGRIALVGERLSSARSNPCEDIKCAHLCVLITASSYRCLCPDGKELQEDGISCSN